MKCTSDIRSSIDIARTRFWIESEGPHANLYSYQGNFRWNSLEDNQLKNEPVNINNLLLRGCTLRNTKWAMGVVAFTGDDTKIMLNAGVTPTKKSRISKELNLSVLFNFALLFVLCFIAGLYNGIYHNKHPRSRDFLTSVQGPVVPLQVVLFRFGLQLSCINLWFLFLCTFPSKSSKQLRLYLYTLML